MKIWMVVLLSVIGGVGLGGALVIYEFHSTPWDGSAAGYDQARAVKTTPTKSANPDAPPAQVGIDQETFDFGSMKSSDSGSHRFTFFNRGGSDSVLQKGETTCRCTKFELEKEAIKPGESGEVRVEWVAKNYRGAFRQTASVITNDPQRSRVTLSIVGRVTNVLKTEPSEELILEGVGATEKRKGTIEVFAFAPAELKITGHEFVGETDAQFFETQFEPMPPDQWKKEQDAVGGVLAHVFVKPGLPVGSFRQTIRLRTSYPEMPEFDIPIRGTVIADVSVIGAGFNPRDYVLNIGPVLSSEGTERTLYVLARGADHEKIQLKPIEVYPDVLKVSIGESRELPERSVTQIPVKISIPKGSRLANHLTSETTGLGRIVLETSHSQAPKLQVSVRFAVRD